MLTKNIGPTRLIPTGKSSKEAPLRNMIEDGTLLSDPHRILRAHDIAERAHAEVLGEPSPPRIEHARVRTDLVAFRVKMVLDGTETPITQLIGCLCELRPITNDLVVALSVAPERTQGL